MFSAKNNSVVRNVFVVLAVLILMFVPIVAQATQYVANLQSGIFHYQGCKWEQKMWEVNRVYYNSREGCLADGYRPCKVCRP